MQIYNVDRRFGGNFLKDLKLKIKASAGTWTVFNWQKKE